MASSLKVIALISGGKDSLFSILHCLANGHEVVALANLHPPLSPASEGTKVDGDQVEEEEDLNSYMYQTVGHSVIPLYGEALGIPLYRQEIRGAAVNKERDYSAPISTVHASLPSNSKDNEGAQVIPADNAPDEDETESLLPLLQGVLEHHPSANAVCTGAILSTYQRTRVESICLRLNLTPLSYLWQFPSLPPYSQSALLRDMNAVGQDARIIKVASGGLDPGFLGLNVADQRVVLRLGRAVARFGDAVDGAVLGEGGEFETLAVDGPWPVWKKRIEVEFDGEVLGEGGSACARWKSAKVVEKHADVNEQDELMSLRIPVLWDDEFKKIQEAAKDAALLSQQPPEGLDLLGPSLAPLYFRTRISESATTLTISNLSVPGHSPSAQLTYILELLADILTPRSLSFDSILHTTLLLRSIADFGILNPIYSKPFTAPNPPSRVTVACGERMPEGIDVMLSVIVGKAESGARKGLHVQSRSYWAPANIGPYSQAISTTIPRALPTADPSESDGSQRPNVVFVAGQIPLVPASMEILQSASSERKTAFVKLAVLSLQHLWRIGRAVGVNWWMAGVAYISDCPAEEGEERVNTVTSTWKGIHETLLPRGKDIGDGDFEGDDGEEDGDDNEVDVWDMKHRAHFNQPTINDSTLRPPLPAPSCIVSTPKSSTLNSCKRHLKGMAPIPPIFTVQVSSLPRNAPIEWWSIGLGSAKIAHLSPDTPSSESRAEFGKWVSAGNILSTSSSYLAYSIPATLSVCSSSLFSSLFTTHTSLQPEDVEFEHITLFISAGFASPSADGKVDQVNDVLDGFPGCTQVVPCMRVWDECGREVQACMVVRWIDGKEKGRGE